jgi:hypothetical protein
MNVLSIPVANAAALVEAGYTTIEIWSSCALPAPLRFKEITSATAEPAMLTSAAANTLFNLGGFSLSFSINGVTQPTISFDSVLKYWTPTQTAETINTTVGSSVATVVGSSVVLSSSTTGRASVLQILSNTATDLGWIQGQEAIGSDERLDLNPVQIIYPYTDLGGMNRALYQWRFSANGLPPISDFYPWPPVEGLPPPVETVSTILAVAQFVDLSGRPKRAKVIIALNENPTQFGDSPPSLPSVVVGQGLSKVYETDQNGLLQVQLIQGLKLRVAIEGTAYVREITVPCTGEPTFDLLKAMSEVPDQFSIQHPLPYLIRQNI